MDSENLRAESSEKSKMIEVVKEIRNKNSGKDYGAKEESRLNWMYKAPSEMIDREDYLLGKAIDKSFETLNSASTEGSFGRSSEPSNIPKRLLGKSNSTEQVDIAKKIHEDPLYAIKQKEMEARRKLLDNPVKLKQLKQMLLEKSQENVIRKKSKKKKSKCSSASDDLDKLILKKLKSLRQKGEMKSLEELEDSSSGISSSEEDTVKSKSKLKKRKHSRSVDDREVAKKKSRRTETSSKRKRSRDVKSRRGRGKKESKRKSDSSSDESDSSDDSSKDSSDDSSDDSDSSVTESSSEERSEADSNKHKKKFEYNSQSAKSSKSSKPYSRHSNKNSSDSPKHRRRSHELYSKSNKDRKPYRSRSKSKSESRDRDRGRRNDRSSKTNLKSDQYVMHLRRSNSEDRLKSAGNARRKYNQPPAKSSKSSEEEPNRGRKQIKSNKSEYNKLMTKYSDSTRKKKQSEKQEEVSDSDSSSSDEEEVKKHKKNYGLMMPDGSKPASAKASSSAPKYEKKEPEKPKYVKQQQQRLSEKEKDKMLREMMENAKWRKEDREKNLSRHRKIQSREENLKEYDDDFMRRQMSIATAHGSVADRIKSKINNIQRSKTAMDQNFMRK